jgi:hypothetical protein
MQSGESDKAIAELPNFEDETCLLDIKVSKEKNALNKKNFRMLVTDYNIILTKNEKGYEEEDSFLIKDIVCVIQSMAKKLKQAPSTLKERQKMFETTFVMNVKDKPSYFFTAKDAVKVIEMLKALFWNCARSKLVIYSVPKKELQNYVTKPEVFYK